MIRTKLGLLGLCAVVFGMMAISASSAQGALSWLILNAAGTTATEVKFDEPEPGKKVVNLLAGLEGENDSSHYTLSSHALSTTLNITCTNFELIGISLEPEGKLNTGGSVKFTGCEAYKTAPLTEAYDCMVHSAGQAKGTVITEALKGELVLHTLAGGGTEVLAKIEPAVAASGFLKLEFELCAFPTSKLSGILYLKDCLKKALTHEVKHLFEQGPLTSLVYGSDTEEHLLTSLVGSGWLKLSGAHTGLKWAAMDA